MMGTNDKIKDIANLTNLVCLDLSYNNNKIKTVSTLLKLEKLYLYRNKQITDVSMLTNLTRINIANSLIKIEDLKLPNLSKKSEAPKCISQ